MLLKKMHPTLDELTSAEIFYSKKTFKEILEQASHDL